jgi:hypothetical protein
MTRSSIYKTLPVAALTILSLSPAILATGARADDIDRRQYNQEQRIRDGLRAGEISRNERRALEAEQARIRELERAAKSDGYVSPRERAQIAEAQDRASRHIAQESRDGERRWWRRWYW